jgi:cobalt-zinc-cadmium efflux system protein
VSRFHYHSIEAEDELRGESTTRLGLAILLNLTITIAEIIGGVVSGSLSLLSDALHNFSDTASLGISLVTLKISGRKPDQRNTFGYRRAQIIGALINLVTLVLIAFYLIREAVERYFNPQPILAGVMLVVALIGLLANLGTAALLHRQSQHSLNIRSAFVHILGDAFSSVGVLLAGILIQFFDLTIADTILTLLISAYILIHTSQLLRRTIHILMQGAPEDIDLQAVITTVKSVEEVQDIHHIHIWQLDESRSNLEAHIVIDQVNYIEMDCIKQTIKKRLAEAFDIRHSTLEFEFVNCQDLTREDCYEKDRRIEAGA